MKVTLFEPFTANIWICVTASRSYRFLIQTNYKTCSLTGFKGLTCFHRAQKEMAIKTAVVALMLLLLAGVGTFLGVFYGVGRKQHEGFYRAAVAADAGPCSDVGM